MLCSQRTTRVPRAVRAAILAAIVAVLASPAMAAVTVVEDIGGSEDNNYASGRIELEDFALANWFLLTSVSDNDFANSAISGGDRAAQYVMLNNVLGSTDVNSVIYSVLPLRHAETTGITISQSPYFSAANTWNGGNVEASQFKLIWSGGGLAVITDPDDQIMGLGDGASFASGTTLQFSSSQISNDSDSWQIQLPARVQSVKVDWSSTRPAANSDLTREWITFDPAIVLVPEPAAAIVFGLATMLVLGHHRRRHR